MMKWISTVKEDIVSQADITLTRKTFKHKVFDWEVGHKQKTETDWSDKSPIQVNEAG